MHREAFLAELTSFGTRHCIGASAYAVTGWKGGLTELTESDIAKTATALEELSSRNLCFVSAILCILKPLLLILFHCMYTG